MDTQSKFLKILASFDTAMLTTRSNDGQLSARPMAIAEAEGDGDVWFVTDQESGKMIDLATNPDVCLTMQSRNQYLSMSGRASTSKNRTKIDDLWQEKWRIWFPAGKEDPSLVLVRVIPTQGEYWDNSGTEGLKYLFEAGKAYLQGNIPEIDSSVNAKVTMQSTWFQ